MCCSNCIATSDWLAKRVNTHPCLPHSPILHGYDLPQFKLISEAEQLVFELRKAY